MIALIYCVSILAFLSLAYLAVEWADPVAVACDRPDRVYACEADTLCLSLYRAADSVALELAARLTVDVADCAAVVRVAGVAERVGPHVW